MTKKERATFVINTLKELYPTIPIPLDHKDPYTLLIAVLLSAQCTDVRVNQITPLLFAKADNPYDMIKMSVEEIKEIIKEVYGKTPKALKTKVEKAERVSSGTSKTKPSMINPQNEPLTFDDL